MRARVRLLTLLVVASLLVSVSGFARVVYVCRMSGRVGAACCCAAQKHTPSKAPALRRADCCEAKAIAGGERLASGTAELPAVAPPALAVVLPALLPPRLPALKVGFPPPRSRGPPDTGPPLYIKHCTLLT
jgi:hypothetical protein